MSECDWFLFPSVKRQLKGKQFQNAKDALAFFEGVILDIPQSTWSGVKDSWFERMVKCVQTEGVSAKNWSRQSGCKCCSKSRLQNIMSDPRMHVFCSVAFAVDKWN